MVKKSDVHRIQVPEIQKRENVTAEKLTYNFLNMMVNIKSQIEES